MDQFNLIKELGSGSFGRVIKVSRIEEPDKFYAMKQIKLMSLSSKEKDNALNQVRLLASINIPNVIKYKQAFFQDSIKTLCIIMEFADGGDLTGKINKKKQNHHRFNQNYIWQVAFHILKGLQMLHQNKIIHRDIKPANIFFVQGVAKLGDLNVSKVLQGQQFATTQTGTPYYTAPEIWQNLKYDGRCDVWSLGCLLYELCALTPPFTAKDFPGLCKRIIGGVFAPIPSIYSKKLSSFIGSCLKVNMNQRPNAQELLKNQVFQMMRLEKEGEIDLIDAIKCPNILSCLNSKLPEQQYQGKTKTAKSMKSIPSDNRQEYKSLGKKNYTIIRSQKKLDTLSSKQFILNDILNRQKAPIHDQKMMRPMDSPNGIVKLPRIGSRKEI